MTSTGRTLRSNRRGGALASAMLFMVLISVAGTALLSISLINRTTIVRNGIDVRVMIAAEAGVETLRGRFTLIQGVQDDWNWLNSTSWTNVGTPVINGLPVTVEARLIGGPSVPTARIRAMATASGSTRVVEYMIKVATFSDYAVFTGRDASLGQNYKAVGNVYTEGDIIIASGATGAQMLGEVTLTGTIDKDNGEPDIYTFPLSNPLENQTAIPFPTWAAPWLALEDVARAANHVYAENTLEIELGRRQDGSVDYQYYRRTWVERTISGTGNGTIPTGTGWINRATGATDYSTGQTSLNNAQYRIRRTEHLIPDEGVIYIKSGAARVSGSGGAATPTKDSENGTNPNNYTQTRVTGTSGDDMIFYDNSFSRTTPVLLLSGTLFDRRVSIACDHKIIIKKPIAYKTLLDNPGYRRFWADGINGKESAGAVGFKEMLGVMAKGDVHSALTWWTSSDALQGSQIVTDTAGEYLPGHFSNASDGGQFPQDGVYMSLGATRPYRFTNGQPLGEYWFNGGLIAAQNYGSGNANHFKRRNYDWDFRMRLTCPPYFLRAYNTSAIFIPGTWRTYTL